MLVISAVLRTAEMTDLDLAFHLLRTDLLRSGLTLTEATQELARRLRIQHVKVIPASDQPRETHVVLEDGRVLHFQEWYVKEERSHR